MHERYVNERIKDIWSDEHKLRLWQQVELAIIYARQSVLHELSPEQVSEIEDCLQANLIDVEWWKKKDKEIHHDLNAFVLERIRHLPPELQQFFHKRVTSYDIEEPAFALQLAASVEVIENLIAQLEDSLKNRALTFRYTIMLGRTHGQWAELQSFGKRILSWYQDLQLGKDYLKQAKERLFFSKISGAIGNYGGLSPVLEAEALSLFDSEPFYGATQIMPREIYLPLASALVSIAGSLNKMALSIRLGARSGLPLYQEPFSKKQTGSSTMPHKKNTIRTEQMEGMFRLAKSYLQAITDNIQTWEERAIEQSCVERVVWPDLFHVVGHMLKVMQNVLFGLVVYSNNMLKEVIDSRGTYASSGVKEFLVKYGYKVGLSKEECYRIVQLATFNVFYSGGLGIVPHSLYQADELVRNQIGFQSQMQMSIKDIIQNADLRFSASLGFSAKVVAEWNEKLKKIFFPNPGTIGASSKLLQEWDEIFLPSHLLKGEEVIFNAVFS